MIVKPGEPGFEDVVVLWNGRELAHCLHADSVMGEATVLETDKSGSLLFEGTEDCFQPLTKKMVGGKVTFVGVTDKP